ncbi:MAG TPA: hypothetical protein ENJ65_03055 [Candidatus Tenderia electrophaga]|uniref:Uncharacterized protein n=1 Tax=Candidatus Tenderia electrophaga TaxID=1748243 RepID=A0A832J4T5_9GAMM|nr:hypothetical protein [Candidatus Tenderia electrophaga]
MSKQAIDWTITCHMDYGDNGEVAIIHHRNGKTEVSRIATTTATGSDYNQRPVFLGVNNNDQVLIMDPASKAIDSATSMAADSRYYYAYRDDQSNRFWFTNDGDKDGNDTLNCGSDGGTVSVAARNGQHGEILQTLLIGRGHHVSAFCRPSTNNPELPNHAFVSNLLDGTISVVGNDENDPDNFLKVITTINLFDARAEKEGAQDFPNNAFPHGMEFSPVTSKVYNLNNGYASVAVINPVSNEIENTIPMKISSNLLLSRCGNFLIGKGADRKGNADHVMGRLQVLDVNKQAVVNCFDIQDFYPSVYRFNATGDRLYVTAGATGKGVQAENLRTDMVQVYDSSKLPELKLIKEIKLEQCNSGRRPIAFLQQDGTTPLIFVPNPDQGSLAVIDGDSDEVIETISVGKGNMKEFSFSFWHDKAIYGG